MSTVTSTLLAGNEYVALDAIEITSIPHISIIDSASDALPRVLAQYKNEMGGVLNEVYQTYKSLSMFAGISKDVSIEMLWATEKVVNQPYNARIRFYAVFRAIDKDDNLAKNSVATLEKILTSILSLQKYEYKNLTIDETMSVVGKINDSNIKAIVKEESYESLQNQLLPYCYAFDRITPTEDDFSRLVNVLIDYPDCAVSMQLIPTILSEMEMAEIDRVTQALDILSKGVSDETLGSVSFANAEKHAETYKYYNEHKNQAWFSYNILVYGTGDAINSISNRLFGQLSSRPGASIDLKMVNIYAGEVNKNGNFYPLPWAVNEILMGRDRNAQIWNSNLFSPALYRLPYIITAEEALEMWGLPIGSDRIQAGVDVNESGKSGKTYASNIINAGDITVGKLKASSGGDTIGFSLKDLAKHMLVVGTPGSGKTTFSVSLLDRLWKEHKIPFLVIEPAKNEYRALVQSIPDLQVFTPGKNFISPFVFNPFIPPKNVKLETYKSTLKTAFSAAVSMSTPLDKIFEESINNCYSDFRWLDTYTSDDKGKIFNITDFIKCFQETFDAIGYTGDARNIGRAGVVRLNSLVNLFDNYFSIPIEDLLKKPTVIELAAIENADQKALIIALLLLSILAYVNANYVGEGGLKNVILLEEAHVLLDADSNAGQGEANPSAIAQGLVKRMLAEIRSYGVGIVIADQSPKKVSTDVVALTDMKVVFRLVESVDKQIIADSTNMSDVQIARMSKLKPGEAFLFFNKLDEPEEVVTPDYRLENNISISLSDESIKELSTYWNDKSDKLRPYPECAYCEACAHTCDYGRRVLAREIARRIYVKNFKPDSTDFEIIKQVFGRITKLVQAELNDEELTHELMSCVKVHLWRKIMYGTKIKIKEVLVENSIRK